MMSYAQYRKPSLSGRSSSRIWCYVTRSVTAQHVPRSLALVQHGAVSVTSSSRLPPLRPPSLLAGESGTGKELISSLLHRLSPRADRPFIVLNAAALPATLLEAELFGYEKGAFTGAMQRKIGHFEIGEWRDVVFG